jgi:hypothetical protein
MELYLPMNIPIMIAPMTASNAIMPLESLEGRVDTDAPAAKDPEAFEPWLVVVTDATLEAAVFVSALDKDGTDMGLRTNAFERQRKGPMCQTAPVNVDSDLAEIVGNIARAVCMYIMIPTNLMSFKV